MRTRAGIVLIEGDKVALIERFRAGRHYYAFPGGGVDAGETPEHAAVREAMEELGIEVTIKQKVAVIQFNGRLQHYFLVEHVNGKFGSGTGEEYTDSHPDDPETGVYIPTWMPIDELSRLDNVFPIDLAGLVLKSVAAGWPDEPVLITEKPR